MRTTVDGYSAYKKDIVYEIIWVYINPEVSEAVPYATDIQTAPAKVKIWLKEYICQAECDELNYKLKRKNNYNIFEKRK